jgi:hypothetical protein
VCDVIDEIQNETLLADDFDMVEENATFPKARSFGDPSVRNPIIRQLKLKSNNEKRDTNAPMSVMASLPNPDASSMF